MKKYSFFLISIISFFCFVKYWDNPISIFNREGFPISLDYFKTEVNYWEIQGGWPVEQSIYGVFELKKDYYNQLLITCIDAGVSDRQLIGNFFYNEAYDEKIGLSPENTDCAFIQKLEYHQIIYASLVKKSGHFYIRYRIVD